MAEEAVTPGQEPANDPAPVVEPEAPRAFSQEDVDRIVKERMARQKSQYEGFEEL